MVLNGDDFWDIWECLGIVWLSSCGGGATGTLWPRPGTLLNTKEAPQQRVIQPPVFMVPRLRSLALQSKVGMTVSGPPYAVVFLNL